MRKISTLALRASLFAAVLFSATAARALTINASITLPNSTLNPGFDFLDVNTWPKSESTANFGTFDFSAQSFGSLATLDSLSITMKFFNLDTDATGFDRNNITLTLGGIDTGLLLNGFSNGTNTLTLGGAISNGAAILASLQGNGGLLAAGLLDATNSPTNPYLFLGGTASLSLADTPPTPIPFTPSETAGLLVMGAASAWARWRRRQVAAVVA